MTIKILFSLIVLLQVVSLRSEDYPSELTDFFKCLFRDSESGYVFFGSKPVCYYGCSTHVQANLIGTSIYELQARLRTGIRWWEEAHPVYLNDNFLLKIQQHGDIYEILSLNKARIIQVIEENLSLFQYVLGAETTPESIFQALAASNKPFYEILRTNNTLVGILLGFGTQNSILGARAEALAHQLRENPIIPYRVSEKNNEEALNNLVLSYIYNGNKGKIEEEIKERLSPLSIEKELAYIESLERPPNHLLGTYSPRFIFQSYQPQKNHCAITSELEQQQLDIIALLQKDDFTSQVIKRLGIVFSNPQPCIPQKELSSKTLAAALKNALYEALWDDLEAACEGIKDSNLGKEDRYQGHDSHAFYNLLVMAKLKERFHASRAYFHHLKQDPALTPFNEYIYIRDLEKSRSQQTLPKAFSKAILSYAIYLPLESSLIPIQSAFFEAVDLNEIIPGFALGMQGMQEGELREVHVSPEAGYGFLTCFRTAEPLKAVIRLESIKDSSPLNEKTFSLKGFTFPSSEEIDKINSIKKALSYHFARDFWQFYQPVLAFSAEDMIDQLKIVWNIHAANTYDESIDDATIAVYVSKEQQEKNQFRLLVNTKECIKPIMEDLLYVEYKKQGTESSLCPKTLLLTFKNLDGKMIKKEQFNRWTEQEKERLCPGLKEGLKYVKEGDKGTFFIAPELTDQKLFRNPLAHRALIVEFE